MFSYPLNNHKHHGSVLGPLFFSILSSLYATYTLMNSKYLFLNHSDKHEKHNMLKTELLKSSHKICSSHSLPHSQNSNYILIFAKGKNLQSTLPFHSSYPVCQQIPLALFAPGLNQHCHHAGLSCCVSHDYCNSHLTGLPASICLLQILHNTATKVILRRPMPDHIFLLAPNFMLPSPLT